MEESELILRSKQGDLGCFNKLVESYQKQAYNLALRMLGNVHAAEDATQEAFISAWKNIRSFRGGSFKAWLLKITANACRDQYRWLKRRPTTSLDIMLLEPECLPHSDDSPEDYAERQELGREIQSGLARLPMEQRLAVILRDIQGLSYEEIAGVMGSSIGTVRSRISRGRTGMRDFLIQRGTFNSGITS